MIGAIIGDVVGSRFEKRDPPVSVVFDAFNSESIFTDDTVLSVAIADSIMNNIPYEVALKKYYSMYPFAGYGSSFKEWVKQPLGVKANSFGNGSAMRISPIAWAFNSRVDVIVETEKACRPSHNHVDSINGATTIALAVFMARKGESKANIADMAKSRGYDLDASVSPNRPKFSSVCSVTVPQAVWAFVNSSSFEETIRKAIMIGGDSDTIASMAGAIAHAFYGKDTPKYMILGSFATLPRDLFDVATSFVKKYVDPGFDVSYVEKGVITLKDEPKVEGLFEKL